MKHSFLQKEFEVFDSYGFAPRITIEMANRIVGTKTPIQYCESQNPEISVSEQYVFVFTILPPIESQDFGYNTQNELDECKKGKEEKPVAPEDTTNS